MPASKNEDPDIEWSSTQVSESKAKMFYSSFLSEGVEYTLYDNVEVHSGNNEEPYIGKIIKLWEEKQTGMKKVLIRWFLRLRDLDSEVEGDPKELYLAFGKGKGVTNENDLEVICGKCKVLCTSKDPRNKQPSASDLRNANFFFSKIYNVDLQHFSPVQRVVDKLGCEAVFNKQEWVAEILKDKDEKLKELTAVFNSKAESLAHSAPASRPNQEETSRDIGQQASKVSVLKRHQAASADDASTKKLKTDSTIPSTMEAAARGLHKKDKISLSDEVRGIINFEVVGQEVQSKTPSDEIRGSKNLKVNGQEVESKTHCTTQLEAKSSNLEKSSSFRKSAVAEAVKVYGQEDQNQLVLPACAPPQVDSKSSKLERSPSLKKTPSSEAILPSNYVLGRAVTNSKSSKQLPELESLAKGNMSKNLKVDGKEVQSKTDCNPSQHEARTLKMEKSSSFRKTVGAEAVKVCGKEEQNKLALTACAPPQVQLKSPYVERSSSSKKTSVTEAILAKVDDDVALPPCAPPHVELKASSMEVSSSSSFKKIIVNEALTPKVDDVLGQVVTDPKISRQLAEMESLAKGDQSAMEAVRTSPKVDDSLGPTATKSNNSRLLVTNNSLPKPDQSAKNGASLESPKTKEKILEVPKDSSKLANDHSGTAEAEKSKIKRSNSILKGKREAEQTEQANAPTADLSLTETSNEGRIILSSLLDPESPVKESTLKQEGPDAIQKPKLGTGKEIDKKLILPPIEKRRIFKELPWEENLQQGLNFGKVLLLQNLDPSLTSGDVRDMLKSILQGVSDVGIIPQETACPYGQALVIFDSRVLADSALQEMERKCLVLASNRRPVIASKFKEATSLTRFPGHLALDKLKLSRNLGADDYKKAVSTSHSSQPNTIEYEMAMEWRRLQEITQTCRVELFEKQRKEIEEVRNGCDRKGF